MSFACSRSRARPQRRTAGFTLLELVLVLFILAILTTTSLALLENDDSQRRYESSLVKLQQVEQALLAEIPLGSGTAYGGFLLDNGVLPPAAVNPITALTANDTAWSLVGADEWQALSTVQPWYFNGATVQRHQLINVPPLTKGFRGRYLDADAGTAGAFADGWGDPFTVNESAGDIEVIATFTGGTKPANLNLPDESRTLRASEWQVAPTDLNVEILIDATPLELALTDPQLQVAVAVFLNSATADPAERWVTFHADYAPLADGTTFRSADAAWFVDGTAATTEQLPVGQHLLLVVDADAGTVNGSAEVLARQRFTVVPGVSVQAPTTMTVDPSP